MVENASIRAPEIFLEPDIDGGNNGTPVLEPHATAAVDVIPCC
jgi:hypothetical protein